MSRPLNILEVEEKIRLLNETREMLVESKCEEGALAISGVLHAYRKIIGDLK